MFVDFHFEYSIPCEPLEIIKCNIYNETMFFTQEKGVYE